MEINITAETRHEILKMLIEANLQMEGIYKPMTLDHLRSLNYIPDINGVYPLTLELKPSGQQVHILCKPRFFRRQPPRVGWYVVIVSSDTYAALEAAQPEERDGLLVDALHMADEDARVWCARHGAD